MIVKWYQVRIKNFDPIVDLYYGLHASDFYSEAELLRLEKDAVRTAFQRVGSFRRYGLMPF